MQKGVAMSGNELKPGRSSNSRAQKHFMVGFVMGVLVVLTYLVVSQVSTISAHYVVITAAQWITAKEQVKASGETEKVKVACDTEGLYSETCELDGDVRTNGTTLSVNIVPATQSEHREWRIQPYSRRTVSSINKVTVTQLPDRGAAAPCTVTHDVPAVLFALGGHAGNFWHAFSDVLVPLFVASRRYDGEVLFLITNNQPWWLVKYDALVRRLSRHDPVDLDRDAEVRCFRHLTVGLRIDKWFTVVPELALGPGGRQRLTMADFTGLVREAYELPRDAPTREPEKKPRLLLMHRGHSRQWLNEPEVQRAAEAAGFEVVVREMPRYGPAKEQAQTVNSFDVLLGVHGAGLTHQLFLPPGGVLIQVVPFGKMENISRSEYGEPATDMGLKYLDYSVSVEESSLPEMLGPDHQVIRDPDSVHRSGWDMVNEFYLQKQHVRVDIARFAPTLAQAYDHLRQL
ncbi:hypothetical protein EJB05_31870, partial [Eragrostis curvula]